VGTATLDTVRVTNAGNAPLHVTGASTGSANLTIGRTSLTLAPGASDTLGVTFRPTAGTGYVATLVLPNDAGPNVNVALTGTGDANNSIVIISPKGGVGWQYGKIYNVTWQSQGVTNVAVEYRTSEVGPWLTIADPVPAAAGTQSWVIPNAPTTQARVRVRQVGGALSAVSELFALTVPSFVVASPYDFGAVVPFYATWDTIHVANPGTAPMTITNIVSDDPNFTFARTTMVVQAASFDTLAVWFRPTSAGPDSALITFTDDTPAGSHTLRTRGRGQTPTGGGDALPLAFALEPNQPNPFGLRTTIRYAVPTKSHVRLEVFDLAGRRVSTLVDADRDPGRHAAVFEGKDLASGVYFVRMTAGRFESTRKILYLVR
jgi:hypothetical protein